MVQVIIKLLKSKIKNKLKGIIGLPFGKLVEEKKFPKWFNAKVEKRC